MALYNYVRRELPGAGAQQYAFLPTFTLPLISLPGPGTPYWFQWKVTQPQQVYYQQRQRLDGFEGVVAGQMAFQALLDTRGVQGASG